MVNKNSDARRKKAAQIKNIFELLGKHTQIICVSLENVSSLQCQQIRRDIYKKGGCLVIGKNTIIKKAFELRINGIPEGDSDYAFLEGQKDVRTIPELKSLNDIIEGKMGLIFTDQAVFDLKPMVEANQVQAPAKVGTFAPLDVTIPPGPTGMDPSQISFFHALNISTKIQKGQIEITKDYQVCKVGQKIGNSEVALLSKMNIKPFSYQMNVFACYDKGNILDKEVVSISPSDILNKFRAGVKNIAAISLQTGYVTEAVVPYTLVNAFKNLAAIGIEVDYKFKQLTAAQSGGSAPAAGGKAAPAAKVVEQEPEEPEEDMDMGALFG